MQPLSLRRISNAKLNQCQILIKQELEEIEKLVTENQGLRRELQQASANYHALEQTVKQLQGQKEQQQRDSKGRAQQIISENLKLTLELAQKNSQISNLQHELTTLRQQLASSKRQHSKREEELAASRKEAGLLLQRIKLQEEERSELARRIGETDQYHQIEVQELKKINSIIRRNFQEMERDYDSLLRLTDQDTKEHQLRKPQPQRKQKPPKASSNPARKLSQTNPEMAEQLWQIKKQVSDQMSRISSSREQAVKGRVDRTLATIQSLLMEMSQRADSDCESD